jgi:integrase
MRFFALTGFRRSEVLGHETTARVDGRQGLRWGDVDLRSRLVHLHDTKTGRQTRAIGDAAVELLREAKPEGAEAADTVCPGRFRERPYGGIDRARLKLWALAGIEGVDVHSLRHTFASVGAHVDGGRYAGHVSALLGHGYQSRAITERYITANPQALRPAATAIAAEVERLLGEGEEGDAR